MDNTPNEIVRRIVCSACCDITYFSIASTCKRFAEIVNWIISSINMRLRQNIAHCRPCLLHIETTLWLKYIIDSDEHNYISISGVLGVKCIHINLRTNVIHFKQQWKYPIKITTDEQVDYYYDRLPLISKLTSGIFPALITFDT